MFNKLDLLLEDEAEEVIQRVVTALDWQEDYSQISAFNRDGTKDLTQKIMTYIEGLPAIVEEEEIVADDIEFKWDTYHEETIAATSLEDDLDDEEWDEDDYDVEVEYRQ